MSLGRHPSAQPVQLDPPRAARPAARPARSAAPARRGPLVIPRVHVLGPLALLVVVALALGYWPVLLLLVVGGFVLWRSF